jgi:hypothetical protein
LIPLSGICGSSASDTNGLILPVWGSRSGAPWATEEVPGMLVNNPNGSINPNAGQLLVGWGKTGITYEQGIPTPSNSYQTYQQWFATLQPDQQAYFNQIFTSTTQTPYLSGYGTASDPAFTTVNFQTVNPPNAALPGDYCTITFNYPLRVPVGNFVAYQIGQLFQGASSPYLITINNQPCLVLTASCVLPQP